MTDRSQDILQRLPFGDVVVNVVCSGERHAGFPRKSAHLVKQQIVVRPAMQFCQAVTAITEALSIVAQRVLLIFEAAGQRHAGQQAGRMPRDIVEGQLAVSFSGVSSTVGDQQRELSIRAAVGCQQYDRLCINRSDLGPDQQLQSRALCRDVSSNDSGDTVAIGDRQPGEPQFRSSIDQFIRMRSAFQKRKIRSAMQLGIAAGRL